MALSAALQQHRLAQLAGLLQQGEVLHVARADLDHVGPFGDQLQGLVVDGLGDDAQAERSRISAMICSASRPRPWKA